MKKYIDQMIEEAITAPYNPEHSKIQVPSQYDVQEQYWKSSEEAVKAIGSDKIYAADMKYDSSYQGSDYVDGSYARGTICFYAFDDNDAKDRLECFKKEHEYYRSEYVYSKYDFVDIREISKQKADELIAQYKEKREKFTDGRQYACQEMFDHILFLPTTKIYEEMKKSIDWAINLLKKMKDKDEAAKREAWLQTSDGQLWKTQYDKEQKHLAKMEAAQKKRDEKQAQLETNSKDVYDAYNKKSTKYPQYKDGIVPVEVIGGRKFKGKGFVFAIYARDNSGVYYGGERDEWDEAQIYDPISKKLVTSNLKYCKVDDSITPEQCKQAFEDYCQDKVKSTLAWCRSKDPNKSQYELNKWAMNIIKKYHPMIDVNKYIKFDDNDVKNDQANKVSSTIDWAIKLGYGQTKTERIIIRALDKKGIDYKNFESIINLKFMLAYGRNPKVMSF